MEIRILNKELAKIAKTELNEDPSRVQKDLEAIKDWLSKQQYLNSRTDDQWLLSFLRGSKFSLEKAKKRIDNYYTMKTMIPELANGVDPMDPNMQELLNSGFFVLLPKTATIDSPRIMVCRPGVYEAKKFNVNEILRLIYLYSCVQMLDDDQTMVAGQIVLADASGISFTHMAQMTPTNVKKLVMTRQDALPIRQKGVHHINNPVGLDTIFGIFKTFLNEKNRSRLHVHSSADALLKFVPREILPTELGGDAGPLDKMIGEWKSKIESRRQWFLDDVNYKTDESKRPGMPKTAEGLFGADGSFRQMTID